MINSGSVSLDPTPITVDSLTLGGSLQSTGSYLPQTLNVVKNLTSSGLIEMDSKWQTLNVGGNLVSSGNIDSQYINVGGNLENSGSFLVPAVPNYSTAIDLQVGGTLNNTGRLTIGSFDQGGANLVLGRLTNSGYLYIGDSSVELTSSPFGITSLAGNVEIDSSTIMSGKENGFSGLTTVNGSLFLYLDYQHFAITPISSDKTMTINGSIHLSDGPGMLITGNNGWQ